jgi:hypothetical protein
VTGVPYPETPADGSGSAALAAAALALAPRVTVSPAAVAALATYGARVTETTIGSDYPPLTQLTVFGSVTAVVPAVTITFNTGKTV